MPAARSVTRGFFPLDEELQLLAGQFTPSVCEGMTRLGTWMPFKRAVKEMQYFWQVSVTEPTVRRTTEAAGAAYVAVQTAEVEQLERTLPPAPEGPAVQLMSVDGAYVPLVHKEWTEVKTLALGTVGEPVLEKGEPVVHTTELSYFSRLAEAEEFGRLALVETYRRGTETAGQVCGVTDGAEWEQGFIDLHREDAVRILDFGHAAEYVAKAGQAVLGEGTPLFQEWFKTTLHELKHGQPEGVLNTLRDMHAEASARGDDPEKPDLFGEASGAHGLRTVSSSGVSHRQWQCRKRQQVGRRSADERGGNALGTPARGPDGRFAQHCLQRPLGRSLAADHA